VLFIVSGAFSGLEDTIKHRLCRQGMGFGAEIDSQDHRAWLQDVKPQDLIEYGFESEFVGRLPVIAILEELTADDLYKILLNPNNAVVVSKKQDFRAYGIDLRFEDEALRILADRAYHERTGARALVSVVERALLPFEKRLPTVGASFLVVTPELVENPETELAGILDSPDDPQRVAQYERLLGREKEAFAASIQQEELPQWEEAGVALTPKRLEIFAHLVLKEDLDQGEAAERLLFWIQQIKSYEASFFNRCGLRIAIDEEAIDSLLEKCLDDSAALYTQCERLCNILEYGLTIIREKTGQDAFTIPSGAVDNPEVYINGLIRACYRTSDEEAAR
jgi:hypothetical protein